MFNGQTPFLATKMKKLIVKETGRTDLIIQLRNISVNGEKRGCSGFVQNPDNGSTVYLTTEPCYGDTRCMHRYAANLRDFRGFRNRWDASPYGMARDIAIMLKRTPEEAGEARV